MQIHLFKAPGPVLAPSLPGDVRKLERLKEGAMVTVTYKVQRNAKFLRKFFALLEVAYDSWEPAVSAYKGLSVQKNLDRFREDLIVAAGFYTPVAGLDGTLVLQAKSISYAGMGEAEFNALYQAVAQVILDKILSHHTRDELDDQVNRILGFL